MSCEQKGELSIFERLGGAGAIDLAVDKFYEKVLADERIKHFFQGTNMERQREMQKKFLTYAFGGSSSYNGRSMRVAHQRAVSSGLNDSHFDAVIENLGQTLRDLNIPEELIKQV